MDANAVVLLFVKAPARGHVKSRLASAIGADHALNLYKVFVIDVLEMLHHTSFPFTIFFHPGKAALQVREWLGPAYQYVSQNGRDLGERMENAFDCVFSKGFTRAVLIGSDIPDLTGQIIHEAFASLAENDVVLGPSADGGYYLIGFNSTSFFSRPFHGIVWSTPSVFRNTVRILHSSSRTVSVLPHWNDVDCFEDLKSLFDRSAQSEFRRSRTMEYLYRHESDIFARRPEAYRNEDQAVRKTNEHHQTK